MPIRARRRSPRNVGLGALQDTFLVSSVATVLVIRLQLWITNYPQLGGGKLHIAHLLWGGLLMLVAIGLQLSLVGRGWRRLAAVLGGIGFGFFIDEVGKFVTSDNDYFFKPSAAIIYITFICLYFVARWVRARRGFTEPEYLANALDVYSDAAIGNFDVREKQETLRLLRLAGDHPLAPGLRKLVADTPAIPASTPARSARAAAVHRYYERVCRARWFRRVVVGIFVLFGAAIVAALLLVPLAALLHALGVHVRLVLKLTVAQAGESASYVVAAILVWVGLLRLRAGRRLDGYRMLDRALLVQLLIGQIFAFIDRSFNAVWGFFFVLALFVTLRFMIAQETRLAADDAPANSQGVPVGDTGRSTPVPDAGEPATRGAGEPATVLATSTDSAR